MKKPFKTYLTFIENELNCQLFDWQKQVLRAIYDGKYPIIYRGRCGGKVILIKAENLLKEQMIKEN